MASNKQENVECEDCGSTLFFCQHSSEGVCFCDDKDIDHVFMRGQCIFCLFDGSKKFEDEWDCLWEILDGMALGTYNLGFEQGKERLPLFPLSEKVKKRKEFNEIIPLYELYKAGHRAGTNMAPPLLARGC